MSERGGPPAPAGPPRPAVAVFGSSDPAEGSDLYELARQVGVRLARAGLTVVTGGYGGVMEGASRGALEAGGRTIGITTKALAPLRAGPNRYLSVHLEEGGLLERTRELIDRSAGYIILPGKAGTLAELTFLWAMHRAQLLKDRPIVLLGGSWQDFLNSLRALGLVDLEQLDITRVARSPEEAVTFMDRIKDSSSA